MVQYVQALVVAKVGTRYRPLAGVNYNAPTVRDVLRYNLHLIKVFQAEENRLAIEHEIRWASKIPASAWKHPDVKTGSSDISFGNLRDDDINQTKDELEEDPVFDDDNDGPITNETTSKFFGETELKMRFPFIQGCLVAGVTFGPHIDPSQRYCQSSKFVHTMGIYASLRNKSSRITDGSDGTTILDITNPSSPEYAFVFTFGSQNPPLTTPYARMTPLSAMEYIQFEILPNRLNRFAQPFENWRRIDSKTLKNIWPKENWRKKPAKTVGGIPATPMKAVSITGPPSLRASSLDKLLAEVCRGSVHDLIPIIEIAKLLPDFFPAIRRKFYAKPEIVSGSLAGCHLLGVALLGKSSIDLSRFQLSAMEVNEILRSADAESNAIQLLSLSGNRLLLEEDLKHTLAENPGIRTLHLLNTPQIPLERKLEIVKNANILELLDSIMLAYPFAFPFIEDAPPELGFSFNYQKPPVRQILMFTEWTNGSTSEDETEYRAKSRNVNGGLHVDKLLPVTGHGVSNSHDIFSCSFSMEDVNRPEADFYAGLLQFIQNMGTTTYTFSEPEEYFVRLSKEVGLTFASASAARAPGTENLRVGTMSKSLYQSYFCNNTPPAAETIRPGEWSLLLVCEWHSWEKSRSKARYAFISCSSDSQDTGSSDIIIADLPSFLTQVESKDRDQVLAIWDQLSQYGNEVRVCDREEVESYLRSEGAPGNPLAEVLHNDQSYHSRELLMRDFEKFPVLKRLRWSSPLFE